VAETFQEYTNRLLSLSAGTDPLEILASTASRIGTSIAGIGRDDLRARPSPDRWSIAQIVAHLSDAEIVHAYRVRMILAAPGTPIQAYDQNDWSRAQHPEAADAHESLALFGAVRASTVRLYRRLTDEELDRYGVHAERGKESLRQLMRLYAGHDRNHLAQIERLAAEGRRDRAAFAPAAVKPEVGHATLETLDVRLGTIRAAVAVAGTDRLAALTVDFGDHSRTIVAGIRTERASLDDVVGAQALFAINLAPRKIRGQLSEGMLFDIGFADGLRPAFAQPEWPLPDGVRAG
jgi:tRNA-binding EMAP/Myf-like protein